MGLPSSDLTAAEILRLRPRFHELLAADLPGPTFTKVHDACVRTPAGPLFPRSATAGVIYLVRNPCDVAVSFAHHKQVPTSEVVAFMNRSGAVMSKRRRSVGSGLPQPLLAWSGHVMSWLQSGLPLCVARYEDMLADPATALGEVVRFAGLEWSPSRVARAVEHSDFDRLRAQEERDGFFEKQPTAPSFFRSGRAGDWRTKLEPKLVQALVCAHAPVMERFGYLHEAEEFLAARSGAKPPRLEQTYGSARRPEAMAPQPVSRRSGGNCVKPSARDSWWAPWSRGPVRR